MEVIRAVRILCSSNRYLRGPSSQYKYIHRLFRGNSPYRSTSTVALTREATELTPRNLKSINSESEQGSLNILPKRGSRSDTSGISSFLTDTFGRQHNYLRISLTERCNLRCLYCMPAEGIKLAPPSHNLTTSEIIYLSELFVREGVTKIRLTGGEPTVRKDITTLMAQIGGLRKSGLRELCITTNGVALKRKLEDMVASGLTGLNLSIDSLDPFQYALMTRSTPETLKIVMQTIDRILQMKEAGIRLKLKINCVVMRGLNDHEILSFVDLTKDHDVEVRFIEYMPFDGNKWSTGKMFTYKEMLDLIRTKHPDLQRLSHEANETSKSYQIPNYRGRLGFITSMTHNFCGSCNRLRITSDGNLKVCLFGEDEVSLRDLLRQYNEQQPMDDIAINNARSINDSNKLHNDLLAMIGAAVKRKRKEHAGLGSLEKMKNRPMIRIGG